MGLKINFHKSTLVPINSDPLLAGEIAAIFGCSIGNMPFTYLGLPMGTTRPSVTDLMPLVTSVQRRVPAAASLLDYGSKLTLLNLMVTSLAIYAMCSIKIPPRVLEHLDKLRRYCLWAKSSDEGTKAVSLAAWEMVCCPKNKGGLGVIDLKIQNQGLLLKMLHKFYNRIDLPWVNLVWSAYYVDSIPHASDPCGSFWWRDVMQLSPIYRAVTTVQVGDGSTVLFWKDLWHDAILSDNHPRLYSFAMNEDVSVRELLMAPALGQNFSLPLSIQARGELRDLQTSLANMELTGNRDTWRCVWGAEGFQSRKFYLHCFRDEVADKGFEWIWKSKCTNKWKVFAWLLLADRLNTRNLLKRKSMKLRDDDYSCLLCSTSLEETVEHLFFECDFSKLCWGELGISWPASGNRLQLLHAAKEVWMQPMFMEIFIVAAWSIWKERNNKHIRAITPTRN